MTSLSFSRARKILGLLTENTALPPENSKINDHSQNNEASQYENSAAFEVSTVAACENIVSHSSLVSCFEETKGEAKSNPHFINKECIKSLVPDYDSDSSDNATEIITTEARSVHQSSSSLSSSTSPSSSSSSSLDSESESSTPKPRATATTIVTIDETDSDDNIENTPPQLLNMNNRDIDLTSKRDLRNASRTQSYQISPLYTDESDIDLSDTDPTFENFAPRKKKNFFFYQSSSSSLNSEVDRTPVKGRKRTKNPLKWQQNKIKRLRNKGKSYVSKQSRRNIPARCLKEPCSEKCRLKCSEKINTDSRYELFRKYWDLGNLVLQRAYISSCMTDIAPKYKYTNAEHPRRNNKAFHFEVNNTQIRVCKTFFKSTLDISDRTIFTIQTKLSNNNVSVEDLRGRHQNHKKNDPEIRTAIKEHINSIPRIESHYLRASTSREYIEGNKTITDLYQDFKLQRQKNNKDAGPYITYYKIFTTEFNISFFQPKKDQCDLCNSYYNCNSNQKVDLEEKYRTHIEEKNMSRIEKLNDRNKVDNNFRVAVYDLEAVLQCPKGDTSSFYYKSKLNCYNLTITELSDKTSKVAYKNVHCFFWTECDAKRGAIEIGSCIWEYLKSISEDGNEKEVVFYSDNCCGQNKNKYIASLYLFALQTLNIKSITHKFLIRGHTQNEADSVHSLIEKEIKKNLKSGPIYTPDQYIALIKNAKKTKPALKVHEMNFESFYDLKVLQEEWGYNFNTNTDGGNVSWNEIKVLKMTKDNTTGFFYKTSYAETSYKEVVVRNKRKKMKPVAEVTLKLAYTEKQKLSANKKKDLRELISKALIPSFYASFYNTII